MKKKYSKELFKKWMKPDKELDKKLKGKMKEVFFIHFRMVQIFPIFPQ